MTNFIVNSLGDRVKVDGEVTLREAIEAANTNMSVGDAPAGMPGLDTIDFDTLLSGGTITLTSGELQITDDLTINGLGAENLTVSGNNASRVFNVDDGDDENQIEVVIKGLTITGGNAAGEDFSANFGGGIFNRESLELSNSIISGNSAFDEGGGIANGVDYIDSTLKVINSTISDNSAVGDGGGLTNRDRGTLIVKNSTISGNTSDGEGGGIYSFGTVEVTNSTISGNIAESNGGGIYNLNRGDGSELTLNNSTITDNTAYTGGGIFNETLATIKNTIIARNNGTNPDVEGVFNSEGYNLIGDGTGSTGFTAPGDQVGTSTDPIDPKLGPLQDNGGPTFTQALLPGSPAIDAGGPTAPSEALIGLYQFNDPNNLGKDTSGNNNDAINLGATFTASGFQEGAAFLDSGAFLRSPIDVNPSVLPQLTWGAWARPSATNPIRTVLSGDNGGFDRSITIDSRGGSTSWSAFTGSGVLGSGVTPSTSDWTFLAATYNQSTNSLIFYVDGQSFPTTSSFGPSFPFFDIGHNPGFGELFNGAIDNVFVYDEVLSPSQIASIRANGFPTTPSLEFDQRGPGFPRVLDGDGIDGPRIDIGAYETDFRLFDTLTVDTLVDEDDGDLSSGDVSLREAIRFIKPEGTIDFDPSLASADVGFGQGTIGLELGQLVIDKSLTINGLGADELTVSGNNASRVFNVNDGDFNSNIDVVIDGLTITEGLTNSDGGGILNRENLTLTRSIISNNTAQVDGGGIRNDRGTLKIKNSTILGNNAGDDGGGIDNLPEGTVIVTRSTISENTAQARGGGIRNVGTLKIKNSTIADNTGVLDGGGIRNSGGDVKVVNSSILNNLALEAFGDGGGIDNLAGTVIVTRSTISGNAAQQGAGGGIRNNRGTVEVEKSTISDNTAALGGGGLSNFRGTLEVEKSTISGNTASESGGGIDNSRDGTVKVIDSTISDNTAQIDGGGIYNADDGIIGITGTTVQGNIARDDGGGIANFDNGSITVDNSIIKGNEAIRDDGGGIYNINNGTVEVINSLIIDNIANTTSGTGGGILNHGTARVIDNSIIRGNSASDGGGIFNENFLELTSSLVIGNIPNDVISV